MTTFVALDFETADNETDSACSVGLVRVEGWKIVQRVHYLVRPPRSNILFTHIHGIQWQDVVDQPSFGQLWDAIHPLLYDADFLAAHNASFDQRVLHACCDAHGIPRPPQPFICTVQLARKTWNIRPTKLPDVCKHLGIHLEHHQALSDAEACARIIIAANQPQKSHQDRIVINCSLCSAKLRVPTGNRGNIHCPRCNQTFFVQT